MTAIAEEKKIWLRNYFVSIGIDINKKQKSLADDIQKSHPILYDDVLKDIMQEYLFDTPKEGGAPLAQFFGFVAVIFAKQVAEKSSKDLLDFFWQGMLRFKTHDECLNLVKKCGDVPKSFTAHLDRSVIVKELSATLNQKTNQKKERSLGKKKI